MTLTEGTRLGTYEILTPIGAGGMGEVYKARDTKLGREVAIKVLPEAFSQEKERLARFEREARLLASLNHPNIATLFDLQESDGVHFLVLEFVPGETLAERIARGPVPNEEARLLFKQIAEALEAAHEQGIIHRDLKPANIKITPEGKIKVLDFGLAKAFGGDAAASDLSQSPTMTRDATRAGVILGTAAYMSPEQARGKEVDKRGDIWAFGCCLYEALAGRKVFDGDTATDVFAKILEREPEWRYLPETTPPAIRNLVRRCLRKDLNRRLHDMADARIEIEESDTESTNLTGPQVATPKRRTIPFLMTVLVTALVTVALVYLFLWLRREPTLLPSVVRFEMTVPLTTLYDPVALSPDGTTLVYLGDGRLYLREMQKLDASPIPGTEDARDPFFSPDGQWVGFWANGQLKRVSISGGAPVTICSATTLYGARWARDDSIVFGGTDGILRVSSEGGTPEILCAAKGGELLSRPDILSSGRALLFGDRTGLVIEAQSLDSGERRVLVEGAYQPRYLPTGHLVYFQEGTLWAAPFDTERLEITGPSVPVVEGVLSQDLVGEFSISETGSLVYVSGSEIGSADRLFWVDRRGVAEPITETGRAYYPSPRLSPDGKRLAVSIMATGGRDIWIFDLAREAMTRLTFGGMQTLPLWSPDGGQIFFSSNREGIFNIFFKPADGGGPAEKLTSGAHRIPCSISSTGNTIIFRQRSERRDWDIGMLNMEEDGEPKLLLSTPYNEHSGMLSPDDRWLAYVSDESGREEIYLRPFPAVDRKWQVSTEGGNEPLWSRSGTELFYRNGEKMMAVTISTEPNPTPGNPTLLFEGSYQNALDRTGFPDTNYDVSADGERFVMIGEEELTKPAKVVVVLNWFEELRRMVPIN